jgi:hypothetical protein
MVSQTATPAKTTFRKRKALLERSGLTKRNMTSTTAGLRNRIAGSQAILEFGNLNGKDASRSTASVTITNEV